MRHIDEAGELTDEFSRIWERGLIRAVDQHNERIHLAGEDFPHELKARLTRGAKEVNDIIADCDPAKIHRYSGLRLDTAIFRCDVLLSENHGNVGGDFHKFGLAGVKWPGDNEFIR